MIAEKEYIKFLIEANSFREKKEFLKAITIYKKILSERRNDSEIMQLLAGCYFNYGLFNSNKAEEYFNLSIETIKKAIEIYPNKSSMHSDLGLYYKHGFLEYEKAKSEYLLAVKINPKNVSALEGLSSLYRLPERIITLEQAIEFLEAAISIEDDEPHMYFRLGSLYKEKNNTEKMEKTWKASLLCNKPLNPDSAKNIERDIIKE